MGLKRDLTIGSVWKSLLAFSIPMLLSNFFQALYSVVDSWFVGRFVSEIGLSAIAVSTPIIFITMGFVIGIASASTIMISQYTGAGDMPNVEKTVYTSLTIVLIISVALTIIGILIADPLLRLLNAPHESYEYAKQYLIITFAGTIFVYGYNSIGAVQRGLGDSRTPLYFVIIATLINVVLDYVFIAFLHMGVAGAAWATIIAQACSFFMGVAYFRIRKHFINIAFKNLQLDKEKLKMIVRMGMPVAIQMTLISAASAFFSSMINSYGMIASAAAGVGMRVDNFAFMPAQTMGMSVSGVAGQNIGAGLYDRAKKSLLAGLTFSVSITLVVFIVVRVFAPDIIRIFNNNPDVVEVGSVYLRSISMQYLFFAFMFSFNGLIQASGNTIYPMIMSFISNYFGRIPFVLLLSITFNMGIRGVFLGMALGPLFGALGSLIYLLTGRWKTSRVLNRPVPAE